MSAPINRPRQPFGTSTRPTRLNSYASIVSGSTPVSAGAQDSAASSRPRFSNNILDLLHCEEEEDDPNEMGGEAGEDPEAVFARHTNTILGNYSRQYQSIVDTAEMNSYVGKVEGWEGFFIPTYLKGTTYAERFEKAQKERIEAYKLNQSRDDTGSDLLPNSSSTVNLAEKAAQVHHGVALEVVEKPPISSKRAAGPPPLPGRWSSKDKYKDIEVLADGMEVRFKGLSKTLNEREKDHEAYSVLADHPMPPQAGMFYFEIEVLTPNTHKSSIAIGFQTKGTVFNRPPGWEPDSWAYHGDDGHTFCCQSLGKRFSDTFGTQGDVVGCGVNFTNMTAFYTLKGRLLGHAFREIKDLELFPVIGLRRPGEHIRVNFGQSPFIYDIDGHVARYCWLKYDVTNHYLLDPPAWYFRTYLTERNGIPKLERDHLNQFIGDLMTTGGCPMSDPGSPFGAYMDPWMLKVYKCIAEHFLQVERRKIWDEVNKTSTANLVSPSLKEPALIQSLVLQYLSHEGFLESANEFAGEVRDEKEALALGTNEPVPNIHLEDNLDASRRQAIRQAVISGKIDNALDMTKLLYPNALDDDREVYFLLRHEQWLEMFRQMAELKKSTNSESDQSNDSEINGGSGFFDEVMKDVSALGNGAENDNDESSSMMETDEPGPAPNGFNGDVNGDSQQSNGTNGEEPEETNTSDDDAGSPDLLDKAIAFGRELKTEFSTPADLKDKEIQNAIEQAWACFAYDDPPNSAEVAWMFKEEKREEVAERLNAAILVSLNKPPSSALETLMAQTSVLLDRMMDTSDSQSTGMLVSVEETIKQAKPPREPMLPPRFEGGRVGHAGQGL